MSWCTASGRRDTRRGAVEGAEGESCGGERGGSVVAV